MSDSISSSVSKALGLLLMLSLARPAILQAAPASLSGQPGPAAISCNPLNLYWHSFINKRNAIVIVSDNTATKRLRFPVDYYTRLVKLLNQYEYTTTSLRGPEAAKNEVVRKADILFAVYRSTSTVAANVNPASSGS